MLCKKTVLVKKLLFYVKKQHFYNYIIVKKQLFTKIYICKKAAFLCKKAEFLQLYNCKKTAFLQKYIFVKKLLFYVKKQHFTII